MAFTTYFTCTIRIPIVPIHALRAFFSSVSIGAIASASNLITYIVHTALEITITIYRSKCFELNDYPPAWLVRILDRAFTTLFLPAQYGYPKYPSIQWLHLSPLYSSLQAQMPVVLLQILSFAPFSSQLQSIERNIFIKFSPEDIKLSSSHLNI